MSDWPSIVVHDSAFAHAFARGGACRGATFTSDGRARCGNCEAWTLSARERDRGSPATGRFALIALSYVGSAVRAVAHAVAAQLVAELVAKLLDGAPQPWGACIVTAEAPPEFERRIAALPLDGPT